MLKNIFTLFGKAILAYTLSIGVLPAREAAMQTNQQQFDAFLKTFVPEMARKSKQMNKALWLLETTGSADAADLKAELDTELRMLFNNRETYEKLLVWDRDPSLKDPILKRQLNVLIRTFKQYLIPKALLEEIAQKETDLSQLYINFRSQLDGKEITENAIRDILKNENDPSNRKKAWESSKEIGAVLAPHILHLVNLRNQVAKSMSYSDFFQMQLDLQEVDREWLISTFDQLATRSADAYAKMLSTLEEEQVQRFGIAKAELGPWAWSDPFGQEDPMDNRELDTLVAEVDLLKTGESFYNKMGIDVQPIMSRSDMYERPGKNQHAFCINMDRADDIRTLNNVKPTIKWLEVILHEVGHAIYELGYDPKLPWLLREPPNMATTEAMALIAGRQAYRYNALRELINSPEKEPLMKKADLSLKRRQLIFSRWVLVMTQFESELYRNPQQDLNALWWNLVEKYQKIRAPKRPQGKQDWAAKYHIGLAPAYYFNYLLGEMFASSIEETLMKESGSRELTSPKAGQLLNQKLFFPGNRMRWDDLIEHVTGERLNGDAWLRQFAN